MRSLIERLAEQMDELYGDPEYELLRDVNEKWLRIKEEAADVEEAKISEYMAKIEMARDSGDEVDVRKLEAGVRSHRRKLKGLKAEIDALYQKMARIDAEYGYL